MLLALVLALAAGGPVIALGATETPAPALHGSASTPSRHAQEAAFARAVKVDQTANVVTGNVPYYTGMHVGYTCDVDDIITPAVLIAQCGRDEEPVDLYVEMPTSGWRLHERFRLFGVIDRPGSWADVTGHTIYYPFIRAVYVDRVPKSVPAGPAQL
jgi:hypothetical protein